MNDFNLNIGSSNCTPSVVQVNSFSIDINSKKLFDNSELVLASGHIYGLIGKNGCGKTTLLNMIKNNMIPLDDRMLVLYVEQEIEETDETPVQILLKSNGEFFKINQRMILLEKLMEDEMFGSKDEDDDILTEYNKIEQLLKNYIPELEESKIKKILKGLGFTDNMMNKPSNLFSGGWKMRISLAKSLYIKPNLLLLDEPTNHLDLEATIWLGNYLENDFLNKSHIGLVVSHNIGFLDQICTNILNIENSKLVTYRGNYTIFKYNYNKKLIESKKELNKMVKNKPKKKCNEIIKKSSLTEPYVIKINFSDVSNLKGNILSVENISFSYNSTLIFDSIDFGIDINSRITLIGKNGVGKTTLLKLIIGEIKPTTGHIIKNNGLKIGYYHQHFEQFLPKNMTPIDYLKSKIPKELILNDKIQSVRKYLGTMKLEPQAHNSLIGTLSGGQKARVAIIDIIFQQPQLILMDEPTNHLDIETIEGLINGLKEYNGALMIITHDSHLITSLDSELWILKNNKIEFYNNTFDSYCDLILND